MWRFSIKTSTFWFAWPGNLLEMFKMNNRTDIWRLLKGVSASDHFCNINYMRRIAKASRSTTMLMHHSSDYSSWCLTSGNFIFVLAIRPDFWNDTENEWATFWLSLLLSMCACAWKVCLHSRLYSVCERRKKMYWLILHLFATESHWHGTTFLHLICVYVFWHDWSLFCTSSPHLSFIILDAEKCGSRLLVCRLITTAERQTFVFVCLCIYLWDFMASEQYKHSCMLNGYVSAGIKLN